MPQNITEVPGWDTPLTAPSGGDPRTSSAWLAHLQKFANRLGYLGQLLGITADYLIDVPLVAPYSSNFDYSANLYWVQSNVATPGFVRFEVPVPYGLKLKALRAVCVGAGHASLPATMPALLLERSDVTIGSATAQTITTEATATDSSASVTAYQKWHELVATPGAGVAALTGRTLWARLTGESGANAVANGFLCLKVVAEIGL